MAIISFPGLAAKPVPPAKGVHLTRLDGRLEQMELSLARLLTNISLVDLAMADDLRIGHLELSLQVFRARRDLRRHLRPKPVA